jgi:hypothetical protein
VSIQYPELTPLVIGTSRDYNLQVPKADGTLYTSGTTPFDGTETLSATVGLGLDQPAILTPSVAWGSSGAGWQTATFVVAFNNADTTASLTPPGEYVLQVKAAKSGRTATLFTGYLPILQVGGTATALPTYCSLDDMRVYFADIDKLEHPSRRAQFVKERNRARTWFDLLLQRHFRASGYGISTIGYPIGGIGPYRTGGTNTWLQQQLDADYLMVSDDIRECLAKKALGFTLEYQFGGQQETSYQEMAAAFHAEADMYLAPMITAGIDINQDGWPDLVIDLSTADALWA